MNGSNRLTARTSHISNPTKRGPLTNPSQLANIGSKLPVNDHLFDHRQRIRMKRTALALGSLAAAAQAEIINTDWKRTKYADNPLAEVFACDF